MDKPDDGFRKSQLLAKQALEPYKATALPRAVSESVVDLIAAICLIGFGGQLVSPGAESQAQFAALVADSIKDYPFAELQTMYGDPVTWYTTVGRTH